MGQQIDLFIEKRDFGDKSTTNEMRLLAQLNTIKSSAASIDRPADPELAQARQTVERQVKRDNVEEGTTTSISAQQRMVNREETTSRVRSELTHLQNCFWQNPTNYLLVFIAFLLLLLLITRD